jgi:phage/plasmid-like protein (TIGR03299 family)
MAHAIEKMAYVGDTPWHQLGSALPPRQPIEVWMKRAGMDWTIRETPVRFMAEQAGSLGSIQTYPDQKVLYRSDTKAPLSVVGSRYQVVQPKEICKRGLKALLTAIG